MVNDMSADMGWTRKIKYAIENDLFVLLYQPITDSDGLLHAYEALIRMRGDEGELITPAGFLPAAERFGLIADVDRWVISNVMQFAAQQSSSDAMLFNINLSAQSITTPDLLDFISEQLRQSGVESHRFTFEIAETTAISNLAEAIDFITGLQRLGCKTALDDFGTGYASFAYLKELPIDYVKIAGPFIENIEHDELSTVMVRSMHEIIIAMGKQSVAEYVESAEALRMLQLIGIDLMQGYYLGRQAERLSYRPGESVLT